MRRDYSQAAAALGITIEAYAAHMRDGEKWCRDCRQWRNRADFDGKKDRCKRHRKKKHSGKSRLPAITAATLAEMETEAQKLRDWVAHSQSVKQKLF